MLEGINLTCTRGGRVLFKNLHCKADIALQVCGANGAGKTSLLKILCGLYLPQEGEVRWNNIPIAKQRSEFCSTLSFLGHACGLHYDLSARDNLTAARALCMDARASVAEALAKFKLPNDARACRQLSAGQCQRIALARVWLSGGRLWVLDEPSADLDAEGVGMLIEILDEHIDSGGDLIFTSHRQLNLRTKIKQLHLPTAFV